jgi:hypothetical protein
MTRTRTTIALIEEAVQLLRAGFPVASALYCVGTIPFLLALFSFCTAMNYDRTANDLLPAASLGLVIVYSWMKGFQALACRVLAERYTGNRSSWRFNDLLSVWSVQIALQPFGLVVTPIAWLLLVPGAQISSFFLNLSVMGSFGKGDIKRCWTAAQRMVMQNHIGYAIVNLLGLVVFADLVIVLISGPYLVKMLFGVDSFMTRTPYWIFAPSILIELAAIAYFVIDFLQKAIHVIRCSDSESVENGEDLLRSLRQISTRGRSMVVAVLFAAFALNIVAIAKEPLLTKPDLDRKIDRVLNDSRYGWREPDKTHRLTPFNTQAFGIKAFLEKLSETIGDWFSKLADWLFGGRGFDLRLPASGKSPISAQGTLALLYTLAGLVLAVALVFLARILLNKKRPAKKMTAPLPAPDLENENTIASELPPQEWVTLAEKKIDSGDLRLALRALFLANLSFLGSRRLIGVERWKSNRDYEIELQRKARNLTDLHQLFAISRIRFESCWYGEHAVSESDLQEYGANHERIKHAAAESR